MRAVVLIALAVFLPGVLLTSLSALVTPACTTVQEAHASRIGVALGSGIAGNEPDPVSAARTLAAVHLWETGQIDRLHFTGSAAGTSGPSVADVMANLALEHGVPTDAITRETRSRSTLENALSSRPYLRGTTPVLITSGFHAWRAAASFRWAGVVPSRLCRSGRMDAETGLDVARTLWREGIKWPVNAMRATLYAAAARAGFATHLPPGLLS